MWGAGDLGCCIGSRGVMFAGCPGIVTVLARTQGVAVVLLYQSDILSGE